ncbi:hypothetical protein HHK36_019782 [Tetracentron sinense]|uniref:HTH three-helical bundle domain-containing protein n=1 Tax=Tetracentron sinense TaxID=13715 RepID=A0A834Z0H7_TETSI|nr:hypothetical protein HHK36_019782 [Tetracentron sinense]
MGAFPCQLERTAAAALLLLSSSSNQPPSLSSNHSPSPSPSCFDEFFSNISGKRSTEDSSPSDSKSYSSSLTSEGSSEEIRARRLRVLAVVTARCHELKLKVVRRSRSKSYRNLDRREIISGVWRKSKIVTPELLSDTTEASSMSSASSAVCGCPSRRVMDVGKKGLLVRDEEKKLRRKQVGSPYMRRRAEAILKFLSVGCASEVRIREVLGDSPDTSKALRILLRLEAVKRSGAGGRTDPYMYTVIHSSLQLQ